MSIPVTISVELTEDGEYQLMATSLCATVPAGARLLKSMPHPRIQFIHTNKADAESDAKLLQAYLDNTTVKVSKSKAKKEWA